MLLILLSVVIKPLCAQSWLLVQKQPIPEPVTNNAVCGAVVNGTPYVYSFGGIDSTLLWSGIHRRCYRYNTITDTWDTLPPLPDTLGRIAMAASLLGDTIYVSGGYHVLSNGSEISSNKVHRFNVVSNSWMPEAAPLPRAVDDHVQVAYLDSMLYVITGWSNNQNVADVQLYHSTANSWTAATSVPSSVYRSFGASGTVSGDTIFYFGGAAYGFNFPCQNILRKGVIDANDPNIINWSDTIPDAGIKRYRSAALTLAGHPMWLGGASITYNYDGLAYSNNNPVAAEQNLVRLLNDGSVDTSTLAGLPMDLRGAAVFPNGDIYLAGGMSSGGVVSNRTVLISAPAGQEQKPVSGGPQIYPNPFHDILHIRGGESCHYRIMDVYGRGILEEKASVDINTYNLKEGLYILLVQTEKERPVPFIIIKTDQ